MAETAIDRKPPTGEGLTFEKVWAMFQETDRIVKELCKQILKNGFYLIEQTGDTVKITMPEGFTPRDW